MDNLHHQWPQGQQTENNKTNNKSSMDNNNNNNNKKLLSRPPSAKDDVVNCPRCDSTNTKFCYYNNYSLSQPRYFCKGCRRYWTQGGSLRNVPVGGGSRKNRRPLPSPPSIKKLDTTTGAGGGAFTDPPPIVNNNFNFLDTQNPSRLPHDLNLGFPSSSQSSHYHDVISKGLTLIGSSGSNPNSHNNFQFSGGFANFLEFKPPSSNNSLSFSLENSGFVGQGFGSFQLGLQDGGSDGGGGGGGGARVLFPAEDLKPVAAVEQNNDRVLQNGESGGYWSSAMLGGGSW